MNKIFFHPPAPPFPETTCLKFRTNILIDYFRPDIKFISISPLPLGLEFRSTYCALAKINSRPVIILKRHRQSASVAEKNDDSLRIGPRHENYSRFIACSLGSLLSFALDYIPLRFSRQYQRFQTILKN